MKNIIYLFVLILSAGVSLAQDLDTVWTKQYVGLTCVKFTPDGKYILGARGNTIIKFDSATGDSVSVFEAGGQATSIYCMQLTKDGTYVFCMDNLGSTLSWNTVTGRRLSDIGYHDSLKNTAGFCVHPTKNKIYFYYNDTITLFDIESRKTEIVSCIPWAWINNITVSDDNQYIAASSSYFDYDKQIYLQKIFLIDTKDFSVICQYYRDFLVTKSMDFSVDSKYFSFLSTETYDDYVLSFNLENNSFNSYFGGQLEFTPYTIKYIKNKYLFIVSGRDENLKTGKSVFYDIESKKVLYTINYGGLQGCIDVNSKNQIIIKDNDNLVLINSRWFTTSVPPDPRIKINGNMKIKYMNDVLSLDNADSELIKLINIFDINGKLVKTYDAGFSGATVALPFSAPAGVYLVRIVTDRSDYNFKFMVTN